MTELQTARLYGRAVRRWDVPDKEKAGVLETLFELAQNGIEESTRIAACRAIIAAESQNQKDEHKIVDVHIQQEHARLDEVASELGIEVDFIEAVARKAGVGDTGVASTDC